MHNIRPDPHGMVTLEVPLTSKHMRDKIYRSCRKDSFLLWQDLSSYFLPKGSF